MRALAGRAGSNTVARHRKPREEKCDAVLGPEGDGQWQRPHRVTRSGAAPLTSIVNPLAPYGYASGRRLHRKGRKSLTAAIVGPSRQAARAGAVARREEHRRARDAAPS